MPSYPDDYLNHWSDVYVARAVQAHGITLEQFLVRPEAVLARIEARPVVPSHRRHAGIDPLDGDFACTKVRNGRLVMKLWLGTKSNRPTPWARRVANKLRRVLG